MSFADLQQHLTDARDNMSAATASVSMLQHRYRSLTLGVPDVFAAWLSPSGKDFHGKMATYLSDLTLLLEQSQVALYTVEMESFRLGLHVDRLSECETATSKALTKVRSAAKKWRTYATELQSIITKPSVVNTPNIAQRVNDSLSKDSKKCLASVLETIDALNVTVPEVSSSLVTYVLPSFMAQTQTFHQELRAPVAPDTTSVMLSQAIRAFPEEFRALFVGLVPKTTLPQNGEVGVVMKTFTVHDHKGDDGIVDADGVITHGYMLGIPVSVYRKYVTKPNLITKLGQFLWADTFRGKNWIKIRQQRLYPYPSPLKKGNYVYLPMLPYDLSKKAFRIRITDWTF